VGLIFALNFQKKKIDLTSTRMICALPADAGFVKMILSVLIAGLNVCDLWRNVN
jgi:hypothetical protein